MLILSTLQNDVLCEMFNIGVGQSAAALGAMLDDEVLLSVPEIRFVTVSEVSEHLGNKTTSMYCIREPFKGAFSGHALLVFSEERSLELVRALVGDMVPGAELESIQRDALMEVGNVVLNACISSLAEMIGTPFECGMPTIDVGDTRRILGVRVQNHIVMLIHIRFELKEQNIEGFVVFVMNSTSHDELIRAIDSFILRIS
ncbi:MAG: CheC, inhibitor of methylation [Pseudomonas sp.]|nr:CheC, inhibitor of methylation [Pseudomonas sp.]